MIKKTTQAWGLSLSLGSEGGITRYVGTFYTDGDTYAEIIERGAAVPRIVPATEDGTASGKPVLFSQEYLDEKKFAGIYDFSCQYLCDPIPDANAYFSINDFKWYDEPPEHLRKYGASDYAVTEGKGDFTELAVAGVDSEGDLYLLDWWTGRTTADVWIDAQLDLVKKHQPVQWAAEAGVIRRSIEPFLIKRMQERRDYIHLVWMPAVSDKPTNCRSFQARAKMGKVYLPKGKAWAEDLISQLVRFPKARFDDKADVCGLFGRILDNMHGKVAPSGAVLRLVESDYGVDDNECDDWKIV